MTTIDTITLVGLTVLFAVFAATMACAEALMRRRTARAPAKRSLPGKRRPF